MTVTNRTPSVAHKRIRAATWAGFLGLLAVVPVVGLRGADDHGEPAWGQKLRYPTGAATEKYQLPAGDVNAALPMAIFGLDSAPQAMAMAAKGLPKSGPMDAELVLSPRSAVSLTRAEDPDAPAAIAEAEPTEQIGVHSFDVLYKKGDVELPVSKANRTLISAQGKLVAVRDRNLPDGQMKIDGLVATVDFEDARTTAVNAPVSDVGAAALYAEIYPAKKPAFTVLSIETDQPRLEAYPAPDRATARLVWRFTVASSDPATPFVRRYWVTARGKPVVVNYEDRVFLHAPAACRDCGVKPAAAPVADPFAAFAKLMPAPVLAPVRDALVPVSTVLQNQQQPAAGTSGTVTGKVWKVSPHTGGLESRPLAGLTVTVKKGTQTFTAVTGATGVYSLPNVTGPVQVTATLTGPMAKIQNMGGTTVPKPVLAVSKSGTGVVNLDFTPNNTDFEVAQVSAFESVNAAFNFARSFLPANPTKLNGMTVRVNVNQTCNANYSPGLINFFVKAAGTSCPNTAYGDVSYHEYGHAIDDQLNGIVSGGYSEGFGDAMCLLMTRQPNVGRDFFGPNKPLRPATTAPLWPSVQGGGVHSQGHCYSGFCWRLITKLKAKYPNPNEDVAFGVAKQLILRAGVLNPNSVPDAVRLMFFADKQSYPGMPKSKHYDLIKAAADEMKIPHPANPANLTDAE